MGPKVKPALRSMLAFSTGTPQAANLTRFVNQSGDQAGTESRVQVPLSFPCLISKLFVRAHLAPGAGESFIYTIVRNGVLTTMTVTIAGAVDQAGNDQAHPFACVEGDRLTLSVTTSAASTVVEHQATVEVIPV